MLSDQFGVSDAESKPGFPPGHCLDMNKDQLKALKGVVREQILQLDRIIIPPDCASRSPQVLGRQLEFWREHKSWFGKKDRSDPGELTSDQRMSLGLAVRYQLLTRQLNLPLELTGVSTEEIKTQLQKWAK
jgi:hypothetical protein